MKKHLMKSQLLMLLSIFCLLCSFIYSSTEGYDQQFNTTKKEKIDKKLNTDTSLDVDSVQTSSGHFSIDTIFLKEEVNKKDEEKEQQLEQICKNEIQKLTFTLPNSKTLTFQHENLIDLMFFPQWSLTHINEEKVHLTEIVFTIYPNRESVYLNKLYPGYPKISGVDVMQFLMKLSHTCEYVLEIADASDLSTPYMFLHNQNYYDSVIDGKNEIVSKNNRPIEKDEFLKCVRTLLNKRISAIRVSCEIRVEQCQHEETNLPPQNCPVTTPWLGRFFYVNGIFTTCFHAPFASYTPKKKYSISTKNLNDILNKPFGKPQNFHIVELKAKAYPEMLEGCQRKNLLFNLMNSLQICIQVTLLKEQELNPFNIWKSTFPCVTDRVDSSLKYHSWNDI